MEKKSLKENWKDICTTYLEAFCKQYDLADADCHWVGDKIGEIAMINDYFVNMEVIRYAVDNNIPENVFFEWYDYSTTSAFLDLPKSINFETWCKGGPKPYTQEEFERIEKLQDNVRFAKEQLDKVIDELKNRENE